MSANILIQHQAGSCLLIAAALISGCATSIAPIEAPTLDEVSYAPKPMQPEYIPVVSYGRYTLVELEPLAVQRDLLLQVVDVTMPENARASVGDGLRHVLKRSGYQLCESALTVIALYSLPLPAAHLHLGPMTLRDALLTLVGSAWELQIDDVARHICFVQPNSDDTASTPASDIPANEPVVTFPITVTGVRS